MFLFIRCEMESINKIIVNQNIAQFGKIIESHPELEEKIAKLYTKKATASEVKKGRQVLMEYGYYEELSHNKEPVLKEFYANHEVKTSSIMLAFIFPYLILILKVYGDVFKKVNKVSTAAEKVVDGDLDVLLPEEGEGKFNILGHNFNIMANRMKSNVESLRNEKIFLKNIISDISHQLKTPLSSLLAMNELMIENRDMNEDLRMDFMQKSNSQLIRMDWLVKNLLKIARLEAGAIRFKKDTVSLGDCAKDSLTPLMDKLENKKQKVIFKGEIDNVYFVGDEEWTIEALTNIIKNCIEHTKEYGEIVIEVSETPIFSSISIEDNGEGIDKKDILHIFERFYKGSNSAKAESIGIGLALSKAIIEGQDGSISVDSEIGRGSKFNVTFLKGVI